MVKESRNHFLPDNVIFLVLEKKGIVTFLIVNLWFHKEFLLFAPLYNNFQILSYLRRLKLCVK